MNNIFKDLLLIALLIDSITPFDLFDKEPIWPLCGRITLTNPNYSDDCPLERIGEDFTDYPIFSTFGPRLKAHGTYRYYYKYDFNRGIDLECPVGTPVYAILDGEVKESIEASDTIKEAYIRIQHIRPINIYADMFSNYSSVYQNLSKLLVEEGDQVLKGQLIGFSGESSNGHSHLHFEIRNSPGVEDKDTSTLRDCIHPLYVLPYKDTGSENMIIDIKEAKIISESKASVEFRLEISNGELDLERVEVEVIGITKYNEYSIINPPSDRLKGNTPRDFTDPNTSPWIKTPGYPVNPSFFDMTVFNLLFTYTDTPTYRYEYFKKAGKYQSPFASDLPDTPDPNILLNQSDPLNESIGNFNGILISPENFNMTLDPYKITFKFNELYIDKSHTICIRVRASDINGNQTLWKESNCIENPYSLE